MSLRPGHLYLAVAACAVVVHLGALWNLFALDDLYIIVLNPIVRSGEGWWRGFAMPYWPPDLGGTLYRPLPVATYTLDWLTGSVVWFHAVNLLWHAAACVVVTAFARTWLEDRAALVAGLLFAVHPVHVEAVANVVGRAELMAGLFALLAVWAALKHGSVVWSAVALGLGLLSKENAAVAPALIAWGWLVGLARPSRRAALAFVTAWVAVGAVYSAARWSALHRYPRYRDVAAQFVLESPVTVRLTAVAALGDVGRLLIFPLKLRVDYSPAERTAVRTPLDWRPWSGAAVVAIWGALVYWAWRRGRKLEAFGLGWIGIAYLPVSNLVIPIGVLVAERTLYLPSAGLVLAAAAWAARAGTGMRVPWTAAAGVVVLAGAARSALRVPVWRHDASVTQSVLRDSPRSYRGHSGAGTLLQAERKAGPALAAFGNALAIYDRDVSLHIGAADAAFTVGRPDLAHRLLARADSLCFRCSGIYRFQARAALSRGDTATADSLVQRARRVDSLP